MTQRRDRGSANQVTLVGMLTALSLAFLYLSTLSPMARLGITAIAGVFPAGAVVSAGLGAGFFSYGATGILGLLLLPSKSCVILYLLFFGLWPMLKSLLERLPNRVLEWVCKLLVFNGILAVLLLGLRELLLPFLPAGLEGNWLIFAAGNVAFVIYDVGFSKLIGLYVARVDRVLRKRA